MSTEVMTVTHEVTPTQQAAWLNLAKGKNMMVHDLGALELKAQAILLPVKDSNDYKVIDEALAAYRKANNDMIEYRKPFTNSIDTGIIQPLMAFEKRVKDDPAYHTLVTRSLTLRQDETKKAAVTNQKNAEITRFKVHVENEFFRIGAEYRGLLRKESLSQYEIALREKLSGSTADIKKMMATLTLPAYTKFAPVLVNGAPLITSEEMMEVYNAVPKPNYTEMYMQACTALDELFANFDSDVANAEAAIEHNKQQQQLQQIAEDKKLQEDTAINALIATAETVTMETPRIKKTVQVTVIESEQWAKSVMAAFIVNMPHMAKYIRVKSWAKLSIGQMAEYLGKLATDTETTFTNIQLEEIQK